jgi:hypothetical protein
VDKVRAHVRDHLTQLAPMFTKQKFMLGDEFSMLDVAIAPLLWRLEHYGIELPKFRRAADEVRRAHLQPSGLHRRADPVRKGHAALCKAGCRLYRGARLPRIHPPPHFRLHRPPFFRLTDRWHRRSRTR